MSTINKISVGGTQYDIGIQADLASPSIIGSTNNTGSTIASGTYFYINGTLVKAKQSISSGATFTENTNYKTVTAGGLNDLINREISGTTITTTTDSNVYTNLSRIIIPKDGVYILVASYQLSDSFSQFASANIRQWKNSTYTTLLKSVISAESGNFANLCFVSSFLQGDELLLSAYQESGSSKNVSYIKFDAIFIR